MDLASHLFWHALTLFMPALGMGALMPLLARAAWRHEPGLRAWWPLAWKTAAACGAITLLGLVVTGHDGRMLTYLGMVVAAAAVVGWFGLLHPPPAASGLTPAATLPPPPSSPPPPAGSAAAPT